LEEVLDLSQMPSSNGDEDSYDTPSSIQLGEAGSCQSENGDLKNSIADPYAERLLEINISISASGIPRK
jgi:hypothetical protein